MSSCKNLVAARLSGSATQSTDLRGKLTPGRQNLIAAVYQGAQRLAETSIPIHVLSGKPSVIHVDTSNFSSSGQGTVVLQFDAGFPLNAATVTQKSAFELKLVTAASPLPETSQLRDPTFDAVTNRVTLYFSRDLAPGTYELKVKPSVADIAGNTLGADSVHDFTRSTFDAPPTVTQGIGASSTGKYVSFPEYTPPRQMTSGFNPSDKVVTRVARLYYFRDAHRVSQIVNRKATSYNRATVDMKQQFADSTRRESDAATDYRRQLESAAVRAAQQARAAEEALEEHQTALMTARANRTRLEQQIDRIEGLRDDLNDDAAASGTTPERQETLRRQYERELTRLQRDRDRADLEIMDIETRVRTLLSRVQSERTVEIQKTEAWERAEAEERRKAEETFRREVAAKTSDTDTYAPAVVRSEDPVEQVSISVVGEGLIQLRGPRKGVNEVHKMINQLDAPVGQVKVGIHTVQVNGENGERMEKVVSRIQRYLDHSRFLTMQSAEMLRNSVVAIASRQASMVADVCPPGTPQQVRDFKYQEAFFGSEFVQELRTLDSEFLKTGNKLLSLHSMDSTSLSNALFLMALAKNDVRQQILQEFLGRIQMKLPQDEMEFFHASGAEFKFRKKTFQYLGHNANFVSLRGFFDAEVTGADTLNPMQREFIRLAQIFKAQLVTEIELRQRVMERALIEEKIGDYEQKLREAAELEKRAVTERRTAGAAVAASADAARAGLSIVQTKVEDISRDAEQIAVASREIRESTETVMQNLSRGQHTVILHARNGIDPRGLTGESLTADDVRAILFPEGRTAALGEFRLNARVMALLDVISSAPPRERGN